MTYDIENSPVGVAGELVLGGISDETLIVCKGYPRWSNTVTWVGIGSVEMWWRAEMEAYLGHW